MGCVRVAISDLIPPEGLFVSGLCHEGGGTVVLISPDEPGFWPVFVASAEYADGQPDPMDRWSKRVIGNWAGRIGGRALFPSDGPPYPAFNRWALASGRFWQSPVGMLVHRRMGLFASFRGALILPGHLPLAPGTASPCDTCHAPCRTACPAGAFSPSYDPPACHAFLDLPAGSDCMSQGCHVRRACPISQDCGRLPKQSAWHMRQFHT
ncbi:ferredoxin [Paracoccus sp. M683]|uniref:ferredoxin n=1 Tax=Paracoccus sp. M683 TaxID=2594268 RepID=UPI00117D198B|nr:ferredoxin [Paracoccus sp. M683]TRW97435.1 ferredoxin [Paracoccus sp. M683]